VFSYQDFDENILDYTSQTTELNFALSPLNYQIPEYTNTHISPFAIVAPQICCHGNSLYYLCWFFSVLVDTANKPD
jgi:hypothetical protein